jgi:selenocysteine lyase/cysteine desulfurase
MPLYYLQSHKRIHLRILGLTPDGDIDAEAFRSFLDRRTSLVVLSHASNVTGRVLNVGPLFAAAREAGAITLLNAAQTIGEIPVRPTELHADIVAFTGHKRLRGPGGTGGLYVAPHVSLAFSPSDTSVSRLALSPAGYMPLGMMDTATPAVSDFSGLLAALRWHEDQGERCRSEGIRIGALLRRGLKRIPRARVVGDAKRAQRIPIVSFVIPGLPALEVASILARQFGIRCGAGLHCAPLIHKALGTKPDGTVRFSVSGFNTEDDIRRALSAVRSIVAQQRKRSTD